MVRCASPRHEQSSPNILAVKAVAAAQLSMAADGVYSVTLDEAIEAMRLTAVDMSVKYKETSLSVCPCFPCFFGICSSEFDRVSRYACFALMVELCVDCLCRRPLRFPSQSQPGTFLFIQGFHSYIL